MTVTRVRRALGRLIRQWFGFYSLLPINIAGLRGVAQAKEHAMKYPLISSLVAMTVIPISQIAAADTAPAVIDNIIVTANLEPTRMPDIGNAFSIIDRREIERRQSIFVADMLQDLPGVAVSRAGTFGSVTAVRIRGAEANQVMVMIDGIKANDLATGDAFNFANLTAFDIERIEVIRGPQSALWGSDAMAGAINIITRKADGPFDAAGFFEAGSFDTVNGGARVGLAGEKGNVSLSASYLDTEGANISRTGDEKDGYTNLTTTLNGGYALLPNLQFEMTARYTDATNDFDDGAFGPPFDSDQVTEATQAYLQAKGSLSLFEQFWTQQLRLTWVDTDNVNRLDGAWDGSSAGQKLGAYYQSTVNLTRDNAGETTNSLTIAIDYEEEDYKQRGIVRPWGDPNRDENMDNTGFVAEYQTKLLSRWAASLAVRHDDNSDFDSITTWRAATSYAFDATNTRIRASAGTGQKAPTFSERFGFFTNFIGNPNLKPEQSTGWDVGIDQGFFSERLVIKATYFNEELEDEINGFAFDPGSGGFTAVNEDGTSDRRGLETALQARVADDLELSATYTYTDATQPDAAGNDVTEIRRPRHMAAANLNYRFAAARANVNLNLSYTGDQEDDDFSTFPATRLTLDSYTLVNIAAEYTATKTLTIIARVENLFDEDYENVFGFASPGIGGYVGVQVRFSK